MAVTVKNAVVWDIRTQFVLHRRNITLRYIDQLVNAMKFEVFTAVTQKNAVF
jgi:hypothetical protein